MHPKPFPATRRAVLLGGLAAAAPLFLGMGQARAQEAGAAAGALDAGKLGIRPGKGDVSATLGEALKRAAKAGRPLALLAGDYHVSGVNVPSGTHLRGVGKARLLAAGAGPLLLLDGAEGVVLEDLVLDGDASPMGADEALVVARGSDLVLRRCILLRAGGNGVMLTGCSGTLSGNRVEGARQAAIFAEDSRALAITGNVVRDCGNNGILVWRSESGDDGTLVQGNRIEDIRAEAGGSGQNGNAINVFRAGGVIVANNVARRCAFSGVRANSTADVQILGNSIRDMGETAIFVEFAYDGAVVANNLIDKAATGISMTNLNEGGHLASCTGNVVRNLFRRPDPETGVETYGVGIAAEADVAVSGNVVENAPFAGLYLGYGPYLRNVAATGNVLRDCGYGIAVSVAPGAGSVVLSGNLISGAKKAAIVGLEWDKAATGDLTHADTPSKPNVKLNGNTVL